MFFCRSFTTQNWNLLVCRERLCLYVTDFPTPYEFVAVLPRIEIQKLWATITEYARPAIALKENDKLL